MPRALSKRPGRPGIFVERALFESDAFRTLTAAQTHILFLFLLKRDVQTVGSGKRTCRAIVNQGRISFTYEEANRQGFCLQTFSTSIKVLIEHGFLSVSVPGGLCEGGQRRPCRYTVHVFELSPPAEQPWRTWTKPPQVRSRRGSPTLSA